MNYLYLFLWIALSISNTFALYEESNKSLEQACNNLTGSMLNVEELKGHLEDLVGLGNYKLVKHESSSSKEPKKNADRDRDVNHALKGSLLFTIGHSYAKKRYTKYGDITENADGDVFVNRLFDEINKPAYLKTNLFNSHIRVVKAITNLGFLVGLEAAKESNHSYNSGLLNTLQNYKSAHEGTTGILNSLINWLSANDDRLSKVKSLNLCNIFFDTAAEDETPRIKPKKVYKELEALKERVDLNKCFKEGLKPLSYFEFKQQNSAVQQELINPNIV
jgi:hypothetical protein